MSCGNHVSLQDAELCGRAKILNPNQTRSGSQATLRTMSRRSFLCLSWFAGLVMLASLPVYWLPHQIRRVCRTTTEGPSDANLDVDRDVTDTATSAALKIRHETFVYMTQSKDYPDRKWMDRSKWPGVQVICLMFNAKPHPAAISNYSTSLHRYRVLHFPNSTWTSGRNRLLREAQAIESLQRWKFEFFLFFDGDAYLSYRTKFYPQKVIINKVSDDIALKEFIKILVRDRPLRAGVGFNPSEDVEGPFSEENFGCIRKCHMDPILSAYHRHGVDILLPYSERFDNISWYASAIMSDMYASAVIPSHCYVYQEVLIELSQQVHTDYPKHIDLNLIFGQINNCLSHGNFMDYVVNEPLWKLKKKLEGGMGYWSGLGIGDHQRAVGEFPCRKNTAETDFKARLGLDTVNLWRTHCM